MGGGGEKIASNSAVSSIDIVLGGDAAGTQIFAAIASANRGEVSRVTRWQTSQRARGPAACAQHQGGTLGKGVTGSDFCSGKTVSEAITRKCSGFGGLGAPPMDGGVHRWTRGLHLGRIFEQGCHDRGSPEFGRSKVVLREGKGKLRGQKRRPWGGGGGGGRFGVEAFRA